MSALVTLHHREMFPVTESHDAWDDLSDKQRDVATRRLVIVKYCMDMVGRGISLNRAVEHLILSAQSRRCEQRLIQLMHDLGRTDKPVNRATIYRWCSDYKKVGVVGLAPGHKGSERQVYGWESRALHYWQNPSKPAIAAIARWIREEGHASATTGRVRHYINNLPADVQLRGRLGAKLFVNTQKSYIRRSTEHLGVGTCYQGDGHTIDVYLKHPTGNRPWRAELTLWLDVGSRYVPGWWISEAESGHSTLFALSHAVISQNHIPAVLHVDNGSGYKNEMLKGQSTGFFDKLGVTVTHSRPYNAKGKGHIERFFGTMERDFGKRFASYCGAEMDPETLQKLLKKVKAGEAQLPTLEQFKELFTQWLNQYHATPHRGLDGKTPAEMWATLERCPLEHKTAAIFWPSKTCTVRRMTLHLDKREYSAKELIAYNGQPLIAEYNIHDDSLVRVLTTEGRWVCDAALIRKADYLPASRIDEAKNKRLETQIKRKEKAILEDRRRNQRAIDADQTRQILDGISDAPAVGGNTSMNALEGPAFDPFGCLPEFEEPAQKDRLDGHLFDPFEP